MVENFHKINVELAKKSERLEKLEKAIEQHKFIQSCISKSIGQELSQTDKDLYSVFDKEQGK